jgi:hypothetical protein
MWYVEQWKICPKDLVSSFIASYRNETQKWHSFHWLPYSGVEWSGITELDWRSLVCRDSKMTRKSTYSLITSLRRRISSHAFLYCPTIPRFILTILFSWDPCWIRVWSHSQFPWRNSSYYVCLDCGGMLLSSKFKNKKKYNNKKKSEVTPYITSPSYSLIDILLSINL